jgi:hypothetical protein
MLCLMPTVQCLQVRLASLFEAPISTPARLTINDPIPCRDGLVSESSAASPTCDIPAVNSSAGDSTSAKPEQYGSLKSCSQSLPHVETFSHSHTGMSCQKYPPVHRRDPTLCRSHTGISRLIFHVQAAQHQSRITTTCAHIHMYRTWQPSTKSTSTTLQSILSRRINAA